VIVLDDTKKGKGMDPSVTDGEKNEASRRRRATPGFKPSLLNNQQKRMEDGLDSRGGQGRNLKKKGGRRIHRYSGRSGRKRRGSLSYVSSRKKSPWEGRGADSPFFYLWEEKGDDPEFSVICGREGDDAREKGAPGKGGDMRFIVESQKRNIHKSRDLSEKKKQIFLLPRGGGKAKGLCLSRERECSTDPEKKKGIKKVTKSPFNGEVFCGEGGKKRGVARHPQRGSAGGFPWDREGTKGQCPEAFPKRALCVLRERIEQRENGRRGSIGRGNHTHTEGKGNGKEMKKKTFDHKEGGE